MVCKDDEAPVPFAQLHNREPNRASITSWSRVMSTVVYEGISQPVAQTEASSMFANRACRQPLYGKNA